MHLGVSISLDHILLMVGRNLWVMVAVFAAHAGMWAGQKSLNLTHATRLKDQKNSKSFTPNTSNGSPRKDSKAIGILLGLERNRKPKKLERGAKYRCCREIDGPISFEKQKGATTLCLITSQNGLASPLK